MPIYHWWDLRSPFIVGIFSPISKITKNDAVKILQYVQK